MLTNKIKNIILALTVVALGAMGAAGDQPFALTFGPEVQIGEILGMRRHCARGLVDRLKDRNVRVTIFDERGSEVAHDYLCVHGDLRWSAHDIFNHNLFVDELGVHDYANSRWFAYAPLDYSGGRNSLFSIHAIVSGNKVYIVECLRRIGANDTWTAWEAQGPGLEGLMGIVKEYTDRAVYTPVPRSTQSFELQVAEYLASQSRALEPEPESEPGAPSMVQKPSVHDEPNV